MSKEASQSGLSALQQMVKEALACTDQQMVELMIQEIMTRGQQLQDQEQQVLQPDVEKLIAAAQRMERSTSRNVDSDSGDDQYADDEFEGEDEADTHAPDATPVDPPTAAQKSPSSPVTPTIDPVQTSRYGHPFV